MVNELNSTEDENEVEKRRSRQEKVYAFQSRREQNFDLNLLPFSIGS